MIIAISTTESNETIYFEFYLEVPSGNNAVDISWLEAIGLSGLYELINLEGTNYIKTNEEFTFTPGYNNQQKLAELTAYNTTLQTTILDELQTKLKFTGYKIED